MRERFIIDIPIEGINKYLNGELISDRQVSALDGMLSYRDVLRKDFSLISTEVVFGEDPLIYYEVPIELVKCSDNQPEEHEYWGEDNPEDDGWGTGNGGNHAWANPDGDMTCTGDCFCPGERNTICFTCTQGTATSVWKSHRYAYSETEEFTGGATAVGVMSGQCQTADLASAFYTMSLIYVFLSVTLNGVTYDVTSSITQCDDSMCCKECPCDIGFTTLNVNVSGALDLSIVGDRDRCDYEWTISGPGSIFPAYGASITYYAPEEVDDCDAKATITATCVKPNGSNGSSDSVEITINGNTGVTCYWGYYGEERYDPAAGYTYLDLWYVHCSGELHWFSSFLCCWPPTCTACTETYCTGIWGFSCPGTGGVYHHKTYNGTCLPCWCDGMPDEQPCCLTPS